MQKAAKTRIGYHSDLPSTDNAAGYGGLTGAFTYPDSCNVTNISMFELSYDTSTDEPTFCTTTKNFTPEDLDALKATTLTIEGYYNKSDAFQAGLDAKFLAKDQFSLVIEEPNGTDKVWLQVKLKTKGKVFGTATDKLKFKYEFIVRTLPVSN